MSDKTQIPPRRSAAASQIPPSTPPKRTVTSERSNGNLNPREQAVSDIIDAVVMTPLATVAAIQQIREPESISPFTMDIHAVENVKKPIAKAVGKFAEDYPVVAAILDKVGKVSPLGEILVVGISLFMQVAENHNRLPEGIAEKMPGVIPRQELARQIKEDADELQMMYAEG